MDAARRWEAGDVADPGGIAEDLRRLGADESVIEARTREAERGERLVILPENADAVRAFLAADTQWRLAPSGAPLGLDYQGLLAAMTFIGIEPSADLLVRVRVVEAEARDIMAGKKKAADERAARRPNRTRPRPRAGRRGRRR